MNTINVLFLSSVPTGVAPLELNTEHRQIEDALEESPNASRFRIFRHARIQRQELERTLETFQPHIVHFSGHGTREGSLLLEAPDGQRWDLDRDTVRTIFRAYGQSAKMAVLNACHSEMTANVLREVVPYVVGNAISVFDSAAITFSRTFYSALFRDETLRQAFRDGCKEVEKSDPARALVPQLLTTPSSPDPRTVKPLTDWIGGASAIVQAPLPPIPAGQPASRADARRALDQHLLTGDDFESFVVDCLPGTQRRFSAGMNRVARTNLVLELHKPEEILNQLAQFLKDRSQK